MYSPWASSMPCLFWDTPASSMFAQPISSSSNSQCDLARQSENPFMRLSESNQSLSSSTWSLNNNEQQQFSQSTTNYFEPLPYQANHHSNIVNGVSNGNTSGNSGPKFSIIKNMIARTTIVRNQHQQQKFQSCDSLFCSPPPMALLTQLTTNRRRKMCSFCKSNGESASVYTSHQLRDEQNDIECPVLMAYVCPKCGATGKFAHTIKYCTSLSENERVSLPTVKLFKEGRCAAGNKSLFKK